MVKKLGRMCVPIPKILINAIKIFESKWDQEQAK
ncbi:hypothetical protein M3231_12580 [Neobacillus mesonae]|nr:hypothetical protein [Neobacillus mesonae]